MGGISPNKNKKKVTIKNYISWFEIPANNFQIAVNFYSTIYGIEMTEFKTDEYFMAYFPVKNGIGGAIVTGPGSIPSDTGPLIYLNGGTDLNTVLNRIADAGGRVVMGKTMISEEAGYFAIFIDTEGNKLALHSNN